MPQSLGLKVFTLVWIFSSYTMSVEQLFCLEYDFFVAPQITSCLYYNKAFDKSRVSELNATVTTNPRSEALALKIPTTIQPKENNNRSQTVFQWPKLLKISSFTCFDIQITEHVRQKSDSHENQIFVCLSHVSIFTVAFYWSLKLLAGNTFLGKKRKWFVLFTVVLFSTVLMKNLSSSSFYACSSAFHLVIQIVNTAQWRLVACILVALPCYDEFSLEDY